ncbi:MAG: hypothetical protein M9962_13440 [Oligoflexia bacterium]|nr:hypothetical protein [Oligoflexia bacterium]
MQTINYEQLLHDYNEGLNTRLRGFRPAEEFLDIWVPDNDHYKSILNLFEAAESAGQAKVFLEIEKTTFDVYDKEKLLSTLQQISSSVSIQEKNNNKEVILVQVEFPSATQKETHQKPATQTSGGPSIYRLALSARLGNLTFQHEGKATAKAQNEKELSSSFEESELSLTINTESLKIISANFLSSGTPETKALLELFCEIITGLPIQEASDHGAIKLEYTLRDHGRTSNVKGIITPLNADPMFLLPMKLIRQIFERFKSELQPKIGINFFDRQPSQEWSALNEEEKLARAQNFVDTTLKNSRWSNAVVRVVDLQGQGQTRAFCTVEGSSPQETPSMLMHLEIEMRHNLENRMEIFLEERKDSNSKRRL